MRNNAFKRATLAIVCAGGMLAGATTHAADWLSLQGTEPEGAAERARIWGFVQPEFVSTDGSTLAAGPWAGQEAIFNSIGPDLETNEQFNIRRARLGVRGTGFPLDSNVNYFLLAEFGNNGVTRPGGGSVKVTDASVTLNHLKKFTRVRVGQFKTPGSEDGLQAIHVHNYNNFSIVADQLLLERFLDADGAAACRAADLDVDPAVDPDAGNKLAYLGLCQGGNQLNGSVGAYRDIGVQLFNTFTLKDGPGKYPWEVSYAFMVGNGNGIARGDNDDHRDLYAYLSAGQVFGGKGPRRQDWKLYGWYHDGKRHIFDTTGTPDTWGSKRFDRDRWGIGGTLRWQKYRLYGEYIEADGMIFNASDGAAVPGSISNDGSQVSGFNMLTDNKADGWYLDFGYKVLPNLELDVRYDELNRGTEGAASILREFERWTVGAQYFFNKKSRITLNYEFRDTTAPGAAGADRIVAGTDDLFSAQLLVIF
ncbi:MAG: OprO/OprP family phosphate-selective porin [Gammaproteobacteria bacterium]|nr:OprO/OprP family phosphate-selective porin [Gammaproteobacteria bacterium]